MLIHEISKQRFNARLDAVQEGLHLVESTEPAGELVAVNSEVSQLSAGSRIVPSSHLVGLREEVKENESIISQMQGTFKTGKFRHIKKIPYSHHISGRGPPACPDL